jgi:hypothetical protein
MLPKFTNTVTDKDRHNTAQDHVAYMIDFSRGHSNTHLASEIPTWLVEHDNSLL